MKYEAVVFDLGGTLIEYENHDWDELGRRGFFNAYPVIKNILPNVGPPEQTAVAFKTAMIDILENERPGFLELDLHEIAARTLERLNFPLRDGFVAEFVKRYYKPITEQISLMEGAEEILRRLKREGLTIGLLSNTIFPEKFHVEELQRFHLYGYFDFTLFSSSVGIRKPALEIFEKASQSAGCLPSKILFVGDRLDIDIAGANAAGFRTAWKYHPRRIIEMSAHPDYSIIKLYELETILFS